MIITQTRAMLVDAYRELNARKLFWITMGLNVLVVGVFASLGINENGPTFLHWEFDNRILNADTISPGLFYRLQFVTWGTPFWLSWVATILALVSTAGIVPDLVAGGSIETLVSKPISRLRLFITKYVFGLLFATLQVAVFCIGCFLVMWIRGGVTEWGLFMAIPIVVLFFSYLFSVCALLGMLTRSTIAALLITIVLWFLVFAVNATDRTLVGFREDARLRVEDAREQLENQTTLADRRLEQIDASGEAIEDNEGNAITDPDDRRQAAFPMISRTRTRLEEAEQQLENWETWTGRVYLVKTVFPKTQETIKLLDRFLITQAELGKLMAQENGFDPPPDDEQPDVPFQDERLPGRVEEAMRSRDATWIIGTSLAFEFVVLALASVIFVRRDF